MRTLSKAMNDRLEGRGGGSMMMAQGTLKGTREEIRLVFLEEAGNCKEKEMKMELNRDTINKIRGLILFTVITVIVGINYIKVLGLLAAAVNMAAPFILGAAIAFVLNVPMRRIESSLSHVLKKGSRLLRPVSMALSILLVAGVLFLVMFVVAPQLVRTLLGLQSSIPVFSEKSVSGLSSCLQKIPRFLSIWNRFRLTGSSFSMTL